MMLTKHGYSDKVENVNVNPPEKLVFVSPKEHEDIEKNISDVVDG